MGKGEGRGGGKGEGRVEEGGKEGREGKEVVIGKGNKPCLLRFRWQRYEVYLNPSVLYTHSSSLLILFTQEPPPPPPPQHTHTFAHRFAEAKPLGRR